MAKPPSRAALTDAWEATKRRIRDAGDPDANEWLDDVERRAEDGTLWVVTPVREQLAEHRKRLGLE